MAARIAVVTDSTACLPAELARRYQITAVPLGVVIGGTRFDDNAVGRPGQVEAAIRAGTAVTTASPGPERFAAAYAAAAATLTGTGTGTVAGIVAIHLSGALSGTVDAARLAAAETSVPVRVVDSRSLGLGLGFAVLAAAQAASGGASLNEVAATAARRAAGVKSLFAVAAPDQLLAGGRLSPPARHPPGAGTAAWPGPALTARPLLRITGGRIELLAKTRTKSAAIRRLTELAVQAAAGGPADLGVQFLGPAGPAAALAAQLAEVIPGCRGVCLARGDAVIAAHTGAGMLGVVVAPA